MHSSENVLVDTTGHDWHARRSAALAAATARIATADARPRAALSRVGRPRLPTNRVGVAVPVRTDPPATPEVPPSPTNVPPPGPLDVGRRARHRRRQLGLTLDELSDRTGITKGYLSAIETDRRAINISDAAAGLLEASLQMPGGELIARCQLRRTPPAVLGLLLELTGGPDVAGIDPAEVAAVRRVLSRPAAA